MPFRSDDGRLLPVYQPLTRESANLIRIDYDFEEGAVAGARMEARGDGRIEGYLKLAGTRRYTDQADPPPVLLFHCPAATAFEFPHGATPTGPPPVFTVTPDEASINSPGVKLAGPDLEWYPDDPLWHESQTARTAKEGVREGAPAFAEVGSPPAGSVDLF